MIIDVSDTLNPNADDLLTYDAKSRKWKPISRAKLLDGVWKAIDELRKQADESGKNIAMVASVVKENLK